MANVALKRARTESAPRLKVVRGAHKQLPAPPAWKEHPEFGMCRTLTGHSWTPPKGLQVVKGEVVIQLTCQNCDTTRRDTVNYRTGLIESRSYQHPKGYLQKLGDGVRPAKSEMRRSFLHLVIGT